METFDTSEFETPPEEPRKPRPGNSIFWYVVASLLIMLVIIINASPAYEIVVDPNAGRPPPTLAPVVVPAEPETPDSPPPMAEPVDPAPAAEPPAAVPVDPPPASPVAPAVIPPPATSVPPGSLSDMVAQLRPSVVYLFYHRDNQRFSGSGFVLDDRGTIATNAHVVAFTDAPSVMTASGQSYRGTVIARSPEEDLALVHAPDLPREVPNVRLADSDQLRIGDDILVFGFPLGLFSEVTVTPGIVSSIRREENRVQLSAAVNKGNSGGPVFSRATGEVVAVVVSKHAVGESMGFSIPVNALKRFLERR